MKTTSIDFESFVECDNSPFVLFSNQGKILYLNNAAEMLFGYVSKRELYDIALSYAPADYGHKTTALSLSYDLFSFYAISIGYENEEQISMRLYNTPYIKKIYNLDTNKFITTDINILLGANIALFRANNPTSLKLLADQELPAFKIDQNSFSKLLRKALESFKDAQSIDIMLKLLIGEHVIIKGEKKSIVKLSICANCRNMDTDEDIRILSQKCYIKSIFKQDSLKLEIPLIQ